MRRFSSHSNSYKKCSTWIILGSIYSTFLVPPFRVLANTSFESSHTESEEDTELLMWQRMENFTTPYNTNTCRISYHTWGKYAERSLQNRSSEVNRWMLRDKHMHSLISARSTTLESCSSTLLNDNIDPLRQNRENVRNSAIV